VASCADAAFRRHAGGADEGTPQGGVISPLLANLFLHYAFDLWMQRTFPGVHFERYADDAIVHCRSERHASAVLEAIRGRFAQCRLQLHPTKTRIVYCKGDDRPRNYEHVAFDFLGYTFQPRRAKNRWGKYFVSFLPAISAKAAKTIRKTIREWRMASTRNNQRLEDLARIVNPVVRGWMNYYGRYYRSMRPSLRGRDGSTNGFDVESVRRCTGWGASRDGTQVCLSCGNSA
jgi:hypothetical protein